MKTLFIVGIVAGVSLMAGVVVSRELRKARRPPPAANVAATATRGPIRVRGQVIHRAAFDRATRAPGAAGAHLNPKIERF